MALQVEHREVVGTSVGDVPLTTAGRGDAQLLVLTPMAEWMLAALPAGLGDRFTITLMGLPPSVEALTVAVGEIAERLGRPVLLGHSMNGALALAAATTASCRGVIAVTPPAALPPDPVAPTTYWDEHAEPERRRRAREIVAAHEATSDEDERKRLQEEFTRLRRWHDLDFDPTALDALAVLDETWIASVFESGKAVDWPATFRRLQVPVLLALGDYDYVAPPSVWTDDLLPPSTTVHHFERSGHTPYFEEPEAFLQIVDAWMSTVAT